MANCLHSSRGAVGSHGQNCGPVPGLLYLFLWELDPNTQHSWEQVRLHQIGRARGLGSSGTGRCWLVDLSVSLNCADLSVCSTERCWFVCLFYWKLLIILSVLLKCADFSVCLFHWKVLICLFHCKILICLSVSLMGADLFAYHFVYLSLLATVRLAVCRRIGLHLSVYLFVCPFVQPTVCLAVSWM